MENIYTPLSNNLKTAQLYRITLHLNIQKTVIGEICYIYLIGTVVAVQVIGSAVTAAINGLPE
jgi:hypothetical protein